MINVNESTPNATPLPNGTHDNSSLVTDLPSSDSKRHSSVLNRGEGIDQESDEDDEEGSPPPLPHKPPPSSSSASSATPPDLLDDETPPMLPRACSEFSMESYEFQSDSFHQLIAPPEGFMDTPIVPRPPSEESGKGGATSPKRSVSEGGKKEGFRRVRSNPSIISNKVMSVTPSVTPSTIPPHSSSSNNPMNRTNSETVPLTDENEYVIKLKSPCESFEGEN